MYSSWVCVVEIVQDIVSSRRDAKNYIIVANFEQTVVYSRILPGESVYVLVLELGVLLQLIIVIDTTVVVLVKRRGKRNVRAKVDDGALVGFGSHLDRPGFLNILVHFGSMNLGRQIRRLST